MKRTSTFLIGIILFATAMFAAHATAQDCVEPPAGLVSWWPGDGNADDIQNGNDGALMSGAGFAPGMVGEAFSLDGVGDHVLIGNPANLQIQDFTIDAWVKSDKLDVVGDVLIIGYGSWRLRNWRLSIHGSRWLRSYSEPSNRATKRLGAHRPAARCCRTEALAHIRST